MKKKAILLAVTMTITTTPAIADMRIESNRGISQSEWNNSDTYKNFTCPADYGRGEGVDMNYTTTPSDDYWYAYCVEPITPTPVISTPTISTPITETSTVTSVNTNTNIAPVTTDTKTVTSNTNTTVTESVTVTQLMAQVTALIALVLQLLARMGA